MRVIVLESEEFRTILQEIKEELLANLSSSSANETEWINEREAMEFLGIKSKSTLQRYRDLRLIRFSQHGVGTGGGRIIKYDKSSILKYLDKNATDAVS